MKFQMPKYKYKDPNVRTSKKKRDDGFKKIMERRRKKKATDDDEMESLRKRLWPGFEDEKEDIKTSDIKNFSDLPISKKTLKGLEAMKISTPTDIQRESLLYGLKGHDILGAAKTGSGKTLAFLIPILETLFHQKFTPNFGMAAVVISPTRELAYQTFDVLKKLGRFHTLSFGLAIGGMFLREEAKKMHTTNVVICTPGRLLQHFEQTPNFTADEVKVLVLDEADKILDLGFEETLNSIVEALPRQRQTLLFSATQTKSIKSLARLSLKRPIYVSVHEKAKEVTPTTLNQRYIVCEQHEKVNLLWSFLKSHSQKKMLVFLSSCKEVRYLFQAFKKMHPGLTVLSIHGHMKQLQRMEAYELFARKKNVVLLATDVAARGLDFPVVHWVVQVDKPENVDTYIHRVGRTARYDQVGEALLMLLPSEEKKMVQGLEKRKIPIVKLNVSKKRMFDVTRRLESYCASDKELKNNAQKGFISVMKTLYILDRGTFNTINTDAYAASLGLVQVPKLPFLEKTKTKGADQATGDDVGSSGEESEDEDDALSQRISRAGGKKTLDFSLGDEEKDDEDDKDQDIYNVVKASTAHVVDEEKEKQELRLVEEGSRASGKPLSTKKKLRMLKQSKLITFDDDGKPEGEVDDDGDQGLNIEKAKERLREADKVDKETQRQRVKQEHREKRLKEKQKRREETMARMGYVQNEGVAVLGNPDEDENADIDNESGHSADEGEDNEDYHSNDEEDEPQRKKRRLNTQESDDEEIEDDEESANSDVDDEEGEENSDDDDDDDDDEGGEEEEEDDDEEMEADESEEEDGRPEEVEQDEAAVLALLGGKKR